MFVLAGQMIWMFAQSFDLHSYHQSKHSNVQHSSWSLRHITTRRVHWKSYIPMGSPKLCDHDTISDWNELQSPRWWLGRYCPLSGLVWVRLTTSQRANFWDRANNCATNMTENWVPHPEASFSMISLCDLWKGPTLWTFKNWEYGFTTRWSWNWACNWSLNWTTEFMLWKRNFSVKWVTTMKRKISWILDLE